MTMKIALITEDGKTVSQHFGRAPYYLVATIEEGKVVSRAMLPKVGHNHFAQAEGEHSHEHHEQHEHHGSDGEGHAKHMQMAESILDCEAVICGGMGMGAYQSLLRMNLRPMVTDLRDIDEAIQAYVDGKMVDHTERLH